MRALDPQALCLTHFGRYEDVDAQLDAVAAYLERRREPVADQHAFEQQVIGETVEAVGRGGRRHVLPGGPARPDLVGIAAVTGNRRVR